MTVDAIGGVWPYACDLAVTLLTLGVETILVSLGPAPSVAKRRELGAQVQLVETGLPLDWLAADIRSIEAAGASIAELAERFDVDLVHLNQPAFAASGCFTVPVVTVIHSCLATWWRAVEGQECPPSAFEWQTRLVARGLRGSDIVAAPSSTFAEMVRQAYALEEPPIVVPNGRRASPVRTSGREDVVFTAGRLWDRAKGMATLDRVAARLTRPVRAAGATIGPGGESIALHHVEALGPLDGPTLAAHLSRRPVFVSAARYEPFGLAALEAAGAGCALVLADIPTFREIWDGVALFVAPDDDTAFVMTIEALFEDAAMRAHLGESARRRAARFTPARTAAGMTTLYEQVLARIEPPMSVC